MQITIILSFLLTWMMAFHPMAAQGLDKAPIDPLTVKSGKLVDKEKIDPLLLPKVRPLYPEIRLRRQGIGEAFFSSLREVARVRLADGKESLVIAVGLTVPAARLDHGKGEVLFYADVGDTFPMVRMPMHSLPIKSISEIRLLEKRWLQFGASPLLSLTNKNALKYFGEHGSGNVLYKLSHVAAKRALILYLNEDLEAFLKVVPIRQHQEAHAKELPERVRRIEIYPALVEDFRPSHFKYSSPWEATVLIRLTPVVEAEKPVIVEMIAQGRSEGVRSSEVELLIWETRFDPPIDRPAPIDLLSLDSKASHE